jgi:glycosyltransferase involved in cell wall biosynthesis
MNTNNLISIIIPVFNAERYLDMTLDSVLSHDELNIEVIAVDDGSTDSSPSILSAYAKKDNRLKVFTQDNKGVSTARNFGIKSSTGKYVTFLDADDFSNPVALRNAYAKAEETDADVVLCNYNWVLEDGYKILKPIKTELIPEDFPPVFTYRDIPDSIFQIVSNTLSSKLYRRDFIQNINLAEDLINGEDMCFNAEVVSADAKFTILKEELFDYNRFHGGNTVTKSSVYSKEHVRYLFAFKEILEKSDVFQKLIKSYYRKIMSEVNFCITKYDNIDDYNLLAGMLRDGGFDALAITAQGMEQYARKPQIQLYLSIVGGTLPPFSINGRLYEKVDKLQKRNIRLASKVEKLKVKNEKLRRRSENLQAKNENLRNRNKKLQNKVEVLRERNAVQKDKIQAIEKNLGYRVTRKLKRIFKRR